MATIVNWLGGGKTKDILGTLSPSILASGIAFIYLFPTLPVLDSLFILSFFTVIITAILTALSPIILKFIIRPSHFIKVTMKQGGFDILESRLRKNLDSKNHGLIKEIRKDYKITIQRHFKYESEKIELERHKDESKPIYQALNRKEVKLFNFISLMLIFGVLGLFEIWIFISQFNPSFFQGIIQQIGNILLGEFADTFTEIASTNQIDMNVQLLRSYLPVLSLLISGILLMGINRERWKYHTLYMDLYTFTAAKHLPPLNEIDFEIENLAIIAKEDEESKDNVTAERVKNLNSMRAEVRRVQTRRKILLREVETNLRKKFEEKLNQTELNVVKKALERTYVSIIWDERITPRDKIRSPDRHLIQEGIAHWVERKQYGALLENCIAPDIADYTRKAILEALAEQKVKYTDETINGIFTRLRESQDPELLELFLMWVSLWENPALGNQIWSYTKQGFFKDVPVDVLTTSLFKINPTSLHNGTIIQDRKFFEIIDRFGANFPEMKGLNMNQQLQLSLMNLWISENKTDDKKWLKQRLNGTHAFIDNLLRQDKDLVIQYSWLFEAIPRINNLINEQSDSQGSSNRLLQLLQKENHPKVIEMCFRTLPFLQWQHPSQLGKFLSDKLKVNSIGDVEIVHYWEYFLLIFLNPELFNTSINFKNIFDSKVTSTWTLYIRRDENVSLARNLFQRAGDIPSFIYSDKIDDLSKKIMIFLTGLAMDPNDAWNVFNDVWNQRGKVSKKGISYLYIGYAYLGRGDNARKKDALHFLQNTADHTLVSEDSPSLPDLIEYTQGT